MLDGVHIGATWRIRLNRPRAAAMRPFGQITLTTYFLTFQVAPITVATFSSCHSELSPVTLTFERNVDSVLVHHHAKCIGYNTVWSVLCECNEHSTLQTVL